MGAVAERRQPASEAMLATQTMGKPSGDEQEVHTRPTGWDELAPSYAKATAGHGNTAKSRHLAPQVNGTLGWWRIKCLPGDISLAMRSVQTESVHRGDTVDDQREPERSGDS